jgi:hypothetical protein
VGLGYRTQGIGLRVRVKRLSTFRVKGLGFKDQC